MIFVIVFSCLSRGPDDQGLSCGPGCDDRQGKACGRRPKRLNLKKEGRRALPARHHTLVARAGDSSGEAIERRRTAPGSRGRVIVKPAKK
jgi:hypothetical protein